MGSTLIRSNSWSNSPNGSNESKLSSSGPKPRSDHLSSSPGSKDGGGRYPSNSTAPSVATQLSSALTEEMGRPARPGWAMNRGSGWGERSMAAGSWSKGVREDGALAAWNQGTQAERDSGRGRTALRADGIQADSDQADGSEPTALRPPTELRPTQAHAHSDEESPALRNLDLSRMRADSYSGPGSKAHRHAVPASASVPGEDSDEKDGGQSGPTGMVAELHSPSRHQLHPQADRVGRHALELQHQQLPRSGSGGGGSGSGGGGDEAMTADGVGKVSLVVCLVVCLVPSPYWLQSAAASRFWLQVVLQAKH